MHTGTAIAACTKVVLPGCSYSEDRIVPLQALWEQLVQLTNLQHLSLSVEDAWVYSAMPPHAVHARLASSLQHLCSI